MFLISLISSLKKSINSELTQNVNNTISELKETSASNKTASGLEICRVLMSKHEQKVDKAFFGRLIEFSDNNILGWIARTCGSPIDANFTLMINGEKSRHTPVSFCFKDVTANFVLPPGGYLFSVNIDADEVDSGSAEYFDAVLLYDNMMCESHEDVVILRQKIELNSKNVFNENPLLFTNNSTNVPCWNIPNSDLLGLRIDRYSIHNQAEVDVANDVASGYTRFALTGNMSSSRNFQMTTGIDVHGIDNEANIEIALRSRADRPTNVSCKLLRNGTVESVVDVFVDSFWNEFRLVFEGSQSIGRKRRDKYEVCLEWVHSGRGYIDVAACAVGIMPSLRALFKGCLSEGSRSRITEARSAGTKVYSSDYVNNGDFSRWSNGIMFDDLSPRQELADGWRLECRKSDCSEASVLLEKLEGQVSDDLRTSISKFGLKISAADFSGLMRISTHLNREFLNQEGLKLKINAHGCGGSTRINVINRIVIIGRGNGKENVLHVIARKNRVRKHSELVYEISEEIIVKIRENAPKRTSFFLGIEVGTNSEIMFSGVSLRTCRIENRVKQTIANKIYGLDELNFEDAGISEQAMQLKGLAHWAGPLYKNAGNVTCRAEAVPALANGLYSYAQPTIRRPERGFPSIDIVVPIYNAFDAVRDCLKSVIECTAVPYTLICIDDASVSEIGLWLEGLANAMPQVNLVRNEENLGYTRSVNRGISESTADWVCVLNSDCIVTKNWLEYLVEVAARDNAIGIVSPLSNAASYQSVPYVRHKSGEWHFNPLPANTTPEDMARYVREHSLAAHPQAQVANGFCQLIRREMLDSIGLLDEKTFPRGFGEENDLCVRAIKDKWQIRIADDTYVYHVKSQSFGHIERTSLSKEGSAALKIKHPDVDWGEITKSLEAQPALVELRTRIADLGF